MRISKQHIDEAKKLSEQSGYSACASCAVTLAANEMFDRKCGSAGGSIFVPFLREGFSLTGGPNTYAIYDGGHVLYQLQRSFDLAFKIEPTDFEIKFVKFNFDVTQEDIDIAKEKRKDPNYTAFASCAVSVAASKFFNIECISAMGQIMSTRIPFIYTGGKELFQFQIAFDKEEEVQPKQFTLDLIPQW